MKVLFFKAYATPAQREAGNYRKRKLRWNRLDISIETEPGEVREGVDGKGVPWRVVMQNAYGYIRRTVGADNEQIDCYMGPDSAAEYVYIIHQRRAGRWFDYDEDKAMLDFASKREAIIAYLAHYDDPRFMGEITVMPVAEFEQRALESPDVASRDRKLTQ